MKPCADPTCWPEPHTLDDHTDPESPVLASVQARIAKAWQQGRLDARCRDCGETYPAWRQCLHCGSRDMEFREHVPGPKPGEAGEKVVQWCQQVRYPRLPDPTHPRTGTKRPPRKDSPAVSDPPPVEAVSASTDGTLGLFR